MPHTYLSDPAAKYLEDIWNYIAEDNIENADRFVDEFFVVFQRLAESSEIGVERNEIIRGLRSLPHKRYIIFYLPTVFGVEIHRVRHSARNIESVLSEQ